MPAPARPAATRPRSHGRPEPGAGGGLNEQLNEPKARPVLMSGPMVRAILAGRKWQTRRVLPNLKWIAKTAPGVDPYWRYETPSESGPVDREFANKYSWSYGNRYGQAGDLLWVKETWNVDDIGEDTWMGGRENFGPYRKIPKTRPLSCWVRYEADTRDWDDMDKWRPSIHMPRWASRITLEITSVRVELLQEITEEDAVAEGIHEFDLPNGSVFGPDPDGTPSRLLGISAREAYAHLWEEINFKRGFGWESNPPVRVITFRRLTPHA